ncbi:unnamed protein product [Schistosoma mattheei]|uniref:Uncharacterized protein n=1 Tax=Schistosoma mattheei TaxID=31246 RepID=A0A183NUM9_9TREM|nr:unnamed protein product [Schistosoma mattheei]
MIEEDQKMVEAMANNFGWAFTQEPFPDEEVDTNTKSTHLLLAVDFDRDNVLKALGTSETERSTGPDELDPKILRQTAQYIAVPLTVIFNMSLRRGELPTDWKNAIVTAIHKTGPRQLPSN